MQNPELLAKNDLSTTPLPAAAVIMARALFWFLFEAGSVALHAYTE